MKRTRKMHDVMSGMCSPRYYDPHKYQEMNFYVDTHNG